MTARARDYWQRWLGIPRRERWLLGGAAATSVAMVLLYVLSTRSHPLRGDEIDYDTMARLWADGKLWWGNPPFGELHPTAWKAPLYPAFVGTLYATVGESPLRVELIQSLFAAVSVVLTWALARRFFGPTVAIVSAWVVAFFPLAFEYYGLLFPEALAIPLTLLALLVFLGREPSPRLAVASGLVIGVGLLTRPTSVFLLVALTVSFLLAAGIRRGLAMTALATALAALVVLPWTVRNYVEFDGLIPISVQDAAGYGTFNDETAADTENRWAWRPVLVDQPEILVDPGPDVTEADVRSELQDVALEYIKENPSSVPKALFWNGIVRFWDLRRPADAVAEVQFQGRSETVRWIGLGMYYVLLVAAVVGFWRLRGRRELVLPIAAMLIATTLLFLVIGGTRYRAPFEPLIVIAAVSLLPAAARVLDRPAGQGAVGEGAPRLADGPGS